MSIARRAEETADSVFEALQFSPSVGQRKEVVALLEQALVESYRDAAMRCEKAAVECCSEDQDMAHKVANGIRRANTALLANLSSLR